MVDVPPPARRSTTRSSAGGLPAGRVRLGAKALVVEGGEVLLLRERRADGSAFWTLPGGGVGRGETLVGGLRRELAEEICCEAIVGGAVTTCRYTHETLPETTTRYVVFECSVTDEPAPNRAEGVVDAEWFDPGGLPASTLAPFVEVVSETVDRSG